VPITDPAVVAVTVAHTLGLPDQPGRTPIDIVLRFIADRHILLLLDNCEQLLDSCGELAVALLGGCPQLTMLATSREPIGIAGEVTWRIPSLSLKHEAVDLFTDRAQRARPGFRVTGDDADLVREICRRLDGMPLAIELAAARVRALSAAQIVEGLQDRFRLLTGGARTAVRRQQTLRASVDWSYGLLTEPERVLFRRLGVFTGGSTWMQPNRSAPAAKSSSIRSWTNWACWSINRWLWPTTSRAQCGTDCSRRCASTRWRDSANPVRPTSSETATVTTTPIWPPNSCHRYGAVVNG
jgi:predicted ATPase